MHLVSEPLRNGDGRNFLSFVIARGLPQLSPRKQRFLSCRRTMKRGIDRPETKPKEGYISKRSPFGQILSRHFLYLCHESHAASWGLPLGEEELGGSEKDLSGGGGGRGGGGKGGSGDPRKGNFIAERHKPVQTAINISALAPDLNGGVYHHYSFQCQVSSCIHGAINPNINCMNNLY
jgi:hypothetical protein